MKICAKLKSRSAVVKFGSRPWSVYPLLGWGVGLALHGISAFMLGAGGELRERLVEKERDRLRRQRDSS